METERVLSLVGLAFTNDFAYDFIELGIFSTSFTQVCPVTSTKSLFSLVFLKIDKRKTAAECVLFSGLIDSKSTKAKLGNLNSK